MKTVPDQIRQLLADTGLSQRAAARELGIEERTMRRYCSGELPAPRFLILALQSLAVEAVMNRADASTSETRDEVLAKITFLMRATDILIEGRSLLAAEDDRPTS